MSFVLGRESVLREGHMMVVRGQMKWNVSCWRVMLLFFGIFSSLGGGSVVWAEAANPGKQLLSTIEELKATVVAETGKISEKELEQRLADQILPRFDFGTMSRSSLGPAWRSATEAQRNEFVDLFTDLLVRTYIAKIRKNLEVAEVSLGGETIQGDKALVRTLVNDGKDTISIEYRLRLDNDEWHVYDVIVENVGLVTNYRNEFAAIIQKERMEGLLNRLREKKAKGNIRTPEV